MASVAQQAAVCLTGHCQRGVKAAVAKLAHLPGTTQQPIMDYLINQYFVILHALQQFELTPWKIVGLLGSLLFTSRWFVQLYYTRKLGKVVMPLAFWWLSVMGSVMLLAYFVIGKNDSIGIISNFFPAFVSVYNLAVHLRHRKRLAQGNVPT
jgi:lipid-A-disaccharide synthase-like uncharacterized protein